MISLGRSGTVFGDRYHDHVLKTPTEVRNAILYVLNNARRHASKHGRAKPRGWIDPCSSARCFYGLSDDPSPLPRARTWLLSGGWMRAGPVSVDDVIGPRPKRRRSSSPHRG